MRRAGGSYATLRAWAISPARTGRTLYGFLADGRRPSAHDVSAETFQGAYLGARHR